MSSFVPVIGLPGSGNRLMERFLRHHGFDSAHTHGERAASDLTLKWDRRDVPAAVLMVRHPLRQAESQARHPSVPYDQRWYLERFHEALGYAYGLCLPVLPVSYDALVVDPVGIGGWLAGQLGVEYRGWPEAVGPRETESHPLR